MLEQPQKFVNLFQGTDSSPDFSSGNTMPLVCRPFPMTGWTLQTGEGRWAFRWSDAKVQGIRATHQPSPWMGDFGHFTLLPQTGEVVLDADERAAYYSKAETVMKPEYFKVALPRYKVSVEGTPTDRCLFLKFDFGSACTGRVVVDCFDSGGLSKSDSANEVLGIAETNMGGVAGSFGLRFLLDFSVPVGKVVTHPPMEGLAGYPEEPGKALSYVEFEVPESGVVECRVATSYIDHDQARENLEQEIGNAVFEGVRAEGRADWKQRLSRVMIETECEEELTTFYSCLYRALTFPLKMHETEADGTEVHYSPYSGRKEFGKLFTAHGFWDTYRTTYPLYALLYPDDYRQFLEGWMNARKEGGWFPRWPAPGFRVCMQSTHIDAIFADAMVKGVQGIDWEEAYEALRQNAFTDPGSEDFGYGRPGLNEYIENGYMPADKYKYSVSATLDNAYCDFCLSVIADRVGRGDEAEILRERALAYRHVFDVETGFMRGRNSDGSWLTPFDPFDWGGAYMEGGAWQSSWTVPHDPEGLASLHGGPEALVDKLEEMLSIEPHYNVGDYGFEIHEMTEMAAGGFGQYAHSNQPSHLALYLFATAGRPDLTEYWVHNILRRYYHSGPDGFPGDEDNGEMGAWYVLSALGLFPVCPGKAEYVTLKPLYRRSVLVLGNGKNLTIRSDDHEDTASEEEAPLVVSHNQILAGGFLRIPSRMQSPKTEDVGVASGRVE